MKLWRFLLNKGCLRFALKPKHLVWVVQSIVQRWLSRHRHHTYSLSGAYFLLNCLDPFPTTIADQFIEIVGLLCQNQQTHRRLHTWTSNTIPPCARPHPTYIAYLRHNTKSPKVTAASSLPNPSLTGITAHSAPRHIAPLLQRRPNTRRTFLNVS